MQDDGYYRLVEEFEKGITISTKGMEEPNAECIQIVEGHDGRTHLDYNMIHFGDGRRLRAAKTLYVPSQETFTLWWVR